MAKKPVDIGALLVEGLKAYERDPKAAQAEFAKRRATPTIQSTTPSRGTQDLINTVANNKGDSQQDG